LNFAGESGAGTTRARELVALAFELLRRAVARFGFDERGLRRSASDSSSCSACSALSASTVIKCGCTSRMPPVT
jgi:hypothetical protein